ncbi:MAG TPA: catalase family peroxidase [Pseudolabrys sp.]|nr:catalase family peroxidase [Pseudolabrys sp.]
MTKRSLLAALAVLALAAPAPLHADDAPVETRLVDVMNKVFGKHEGFRANHAKGIVVEGSFTATPEAAKLSKASLFGGQPIPVTVRFSDATGLPDVPDGSPLAIPQGMAIKYRLPDGSETDMVLNALKFFPVSTGEEFLELLMAIADSPPDAPKPTRIEQFVASHPNVAAASASTATPDSYADQEYYGINAFVFVNAAGERQAVRYQMLPEKTVHLAAADAAARAPDFLSAELPGRLSQGPVTFHLKAQLAAPGDDLVDPAKPWPADRTVVDLGTLTIDKAVADSATAQKALLFLPGQVTDGIEPSDDPMIGIRDGSYAESFSRRNP